MKLIINNDPVKYMAVIRMILKSPRLFGIIAVHDANKGLAGFKVIRGKIVYLGEPVEYIMLPQITDLAKEIIIRDWCMSHRIEIKET
jgi:hypothetical protein